MMHVEVASNRVRFSACTSGFTLGAIWRAIEWCLLGCDMMYVEVASNRVRFSARTSGFKLGAIRRAYE